MIPVFKGVRMANSRLASTTAGEQFPWESAGSPGFNLHSLVREAGTSL